MNLATEQLDRIAKDVQAVDFDVPFWLDANGKVHEELGEDPPSAYHVEGTKPPADIWLEGTGWETATDGLSGQDNYRGAGMHASEYIGSGIAWHLMQYPLGTIFVVTTIEVMPTVDDDSPEPAGWVILHKLPAAELGVGE